jgi:trans-aconitate 2-methyltransferase
MMADWSPEAYLKFADERSRPAQDLLAQVPLANPRLVYDLGCGPGNSTALLDAAFPAAEVIGVDNSEAMLAAARRALPRREFLAADLAHWMPAGQADLLFSNATFQWVPNHPAVLLRLLGGLLDGAVLAVQMPDNLDEPSHRLMRETSKNGPRADELSEAAASRAALLAPFQYYDLLKPKCRRLDIWHTVYNHVVDGVQGIIDFVSSTGLRPFLDPLDEWEKKAFLDAYRLALAREYPATHDGKVVLRFPRIFIVARV